jgi:hypothetical protein
MEVREQGLRARRVYPKFAVANKGEHNAAIGLPRIGLSEVLGINANIIITKIT